MIIADTDVLIDYLQGTDPAAARIALELQHGQLVTTAITRFELLAGARSVRHQTLVKDLLDGLPCLALDVDAAGAAASVRRTLEASGQAIGMADSLIAGIALATKSILLTRNRRHLERVAGLALGSLRAD